LVYVHWGIRVFGLGEELDGDGFIGDDDLVDEGAEVGVDLLGRGFGEVVREFVEDGAQVVDGGAALGAAFGVGIGGGEGAEGVVDLGVEGGGAGGVFLDGEDAEFVGVGEAFAAGGEICEGGGVELHAIGGLLRELGVFDAAEEGGEFGDEGGEEVGVFAVDVFGMDGADPTAAGVGVSAGVGDPGAGAADSAVEEVGEALGTDARVFFAALVEFFVDAALGGHVPEWGVESFGGDDAGGEIVHNFDVPRSRVRCAAGFSEVDFAAVVAVFEEEADVDIGPFPFACGGGDAFGGELVGDLPEGVTFEEEVFDLDDDGGGGGVYDGGDFAVEFAAGGFAVAVGEFAFVESGEDAAGHAKFVASFEGGDLCAGGEGGDELEGGGGFVGFVFVGGEGFDGLGEGVELDAVGGESLGDGFEEFAEAGVVVEEEDVELSGLGGVEHVFEGGDVGFGVAEVDPAGAGLAGDDEGSGGFAPAFGEGVGAAELLLLVEGDLFGGSLGFGGDGCPDGEVH
jgi:hypothetical protein